MPSWRTKKRIKQASAIAVTLVILGLLFLLVLASFRAISQLNPTVAAGVVGAFTTVIVSVISVLVAKRLEQRALIAKEQREKKAPAYEELLKFIFRVMHSEKLTGAPIPESEMVERVTDIIRNLVIWGSDDVVNAFSRFMSATRANVSPFALVVAMESILLAIRKDLGHQNRNLQGGQILRTFISDLDQLVVEQRDPTTKTEASI